MHRYLVGITLSTYQTEVIIIWIGYTHSVIACDTKCAAHDFGNCCFRPNKLSAINKNPMQEKYLQNYHLLPVHIFSEDHYIWWDPGRIYHNRVKSDPYEIFLGGCIFFDHVSGFMSIKYQLNINSTETSKIILTSRGYFQSQGVETKA